MIQTKQVNWHFLLLCVFLLNSKVVDISLTFFVLQQCVLNRLVKRIPQPDPVVLKGMWKYLCLLLNILISINIFIYC